MPLEYIIPPFWGLFGLILVGLRWRDAGIRAGLFGRLFEQAGNQDCQQTAQPAKNHIDFFCSLALFSQRNDVRLVAIELVAQRSTVYTSNLSCSFCRRCEISL